MVNAPSKIDYNSPSSIKAYMDSMSIAMRKQYGQNFLLNEAARQKLAVEAVPKGGTVWEVGPGIGAMTEELLRRGAKVVAFEIDRAFISSLKSFFGKYIASGDLRIVEGDVLKTWEKEANIIERMSGDKEGRAPLHLFGNLPYNIAATLTASIIEKSAIKWRSVPFDKCVITVQKEVAERMTAKAGSKDYSSLSVVCQWAYKIHALMDLSPAFFWPRPRVASRSLVMERREDFPRCADAKMFVRMTRALFSSRRKTIRNNLSRFLHGTQRAEEVLLRAGIDKDVRAETLDIDTLLRICGCILSLRGALQRGTRYYF